jgi:P27 family predicted phage terminase small subunit
MGLRGPVPEPTTLKVIRGNPGKRPLNKLEPKREALSTAQIKRKCPNDLSVTAQIWWKYYAKVFADSHIVTETDLGMLSQLTVATAERVEFERKLAAAGPLYVAPKTGYIQISPLYSLVSSARDREYRLLREFGASPSSRTAVQAVAVGSKSDDPWDKL